MGPKEVQWHRRQAPKETQTYSGSYSGTKRGKYSGTDRGRYSETEEATVGQREAQWSRERHSRIH